MLPNFIVIGAAKAGTTALYWYLAEHPAVFMSPVKETNYFAFGLDARGRPLYGDPEVHHYPITTRREYEQLFVGAGTATAVGEASPIYLECPQAAGRLSEAIPTARLICSLRHPVDRAYSDYQMYLRSRGQRLVPGRDLSPTAEWARAGSHWMRIGEYHDQLARYFDLFPRNRIHIFLFEDLQRNPLGTVQDVYRFLEVDATFSPDFTTPHNVGGMPSSRVLERVLTNRRLRSAVEPIIPTRFANWMRGIRTRNMEKPPPLSRELRGELTERFRVDIARTSELIGRSLDHWL